MRNPTWKGFFEGGHTHVLRELANLIGIGKKAKKLCTKKSPMVNGYDL